MGTILILPAAGNATRMGGIYKELLPLGTLGNGRERTIPAPVMSWTISAAIEAGASEAVVVTSPTKAPVLTQHLGALGLPIPVSFVQQDRPDGLAQAVLRAASHVGDRDIGLLLLPDTVVAPAERVAESVRAVIEGSPVSVTLHTSERPERFGVARFDDNDRLQGFEEKPRRAPSRWYWTSVAFRPVFFSYLRELIETAGDYSLTGALNKAACEGLVASRRCTDGCYVDVGTYEGYVEALQAYADSVVEFPAPGFAPRQKARTG